ncbi:MAG: MFS transporter [Alistipes inops]|nr:MFS transporter [Alistipes inops]
MAKRDNNRALPIAVMFALFFIIAFVTGLQNPMGVIIKSQFAASNLQSQLGNLANFIAYAFMGIPAGMMLQRMGYKKTALTAIAVGFAGVCVMWFAGRAGSYGIYLAGAFVSGFSMCMLNTVVNPMLKSLGSNEKRGNQLIQFGTTFNSLGATLTPILVGYLMGNEASARSIASANPALYTAMGIFVLAFAVIAFTRIPEPYGTAAGGRGSGRFYTPLRFRHFSLGVAAIFLYVGIEVGIPNIANLYMTDALAMDSSAAGTIVGTYWLLMLAGRLTGGAIGGRVSGRAMLTFASALGLLFIGLFIALQGVAATVPLPVFRSDLSFGAEPVRISLLFLILCGLATSVRWGAIFSLATSGLGVYTAAASGIFMTMVCGGGIMPALQAWIADQSSYPISYALVAVGFAYLLFYALHGSRTEHDMPAGIPDK